MWLEVSSAKQPYVDPITMSGSKTDRAPCFWFACAKPECSDDDVGPMLAQQFLLCICHAFPEPGKLWIAKDLNQDGAMQVPCYLKAGFLTS